MKKILIFKTDRIGDFVNFSPCLRILKNNFVDCHITMVCSKYNYQIAKNYKEIDKIVIIKKNLFLEIFFFLKNFFLTNYDYLFQFDGNKRSYILSCFVSAKIRSALFFYKNINLFGINYKHIRPNFFLRFFFNNSIFCNEDYSANNITAHYQTLYLKLLENLNFKINYKQNVFYLDTSFKNEFSSFFNETNKSYYLFHIDEKSNTLNSSQFDSLLDLVDKIKIKQNIVLSLGIGQFIYESKIKEKFNILDYSIKNNSFKIDDSNVLCLKNLPLNLLAYFIANSDANISMHSGSIVHISAAFNKLIIDIIEEHKFKELDRWIPLESKYKRFDLNKLENFTI